MQKNNNNSIKIARRQTKSSTAVNRRQVKRPTGNQKMVDSMTKNPSSKTEKIEVNRKTTHRVHEKAEIMPEPEAIMTQPSNVVMRKSVEQKMRPMMAKIVAVEEPVEVLVDDPVEEAFEPPMDSMMRMPMKESVTEHVSEIVVRPVEQMMEEPMEQSMGMPSRQMMKESMMQSTRMSSRRMPVESMSYTIEKPVERMMSEPIEQVERHPIQHVANSRMKTRQMKAPQVSKYTAQELKDQAIKKALSSASSIPSSERQMKAKAKSKKSGRMHFSFGRVLLALSCATAAVFAILYFVNMSMPDISLKVAAMQTGINASYPSYVPRDYNVSSITSEDGKISIRFRNSKVDNEFTLIEEASSWDSNALLNNYVKDSFNDSYATVREQGLTLYIDGSRATWVNGGVVYKLDADSGTLTNKQIRSIATSL